MHIKVINLYNHQLSIMIRYSKLLVKNRLLYLFYHLELIHYLMYKNLQKIKDLQELNLNICLWDKVCKKKQICIYQHHLIEVIGLCYKIVIYLQVGSKIIYKNSYKHLVDQIKISDFG